MLFFFINCHLDLRKHFKDHLFVYICLLLIFLFHYFVILSFSYQFFFFNYLLRLRFCYLTPLFPFNHYFHHLSPQPCFLYIFFNDHCLPKSCSVMAGLFASTLLHSFILFFFFFFLTTLFSVNIILILCALLVSSNFPP